MQFERVIEAVEEPVAVDEESIVVADLPGVPKGPVKAVPEEVRVE